LESGVDIVELQKILGHVSLLATVKYTHLTSVTQKNAVGSINALVDRIEIDWGTAV